uniref:Arf-GAP domain-containing protein n=1 Tax=Noctiluca scintillans TaxID=2966 RepID=A0A7S1A503_NOCSC|mmetsp:Transcript_31878/g.85221  ORF Transcript_31878/g.85221 Transcript_31878/m.85221 type:complete len:291 (+) Transcript_31878:58-930(+)|eukprot:CAMPEP_0194511960 /NCGR_PEP_ID=MMETSP0253-20130528/43786_1 /TAXON_ID=2966 /ORGANISM="Noctiluca scintillans" /LENGTH=290 /DNA_ID=CAMNT_0039355355 /DNA_START=27 /DNA_END=899 /DNA_ORIENTATION=+
MGQEDVQKLSRKVKSRIFEMPGNSVCVDCTNLHPQWARPAYGILVCIECSSKHRSLAGQDPILSVQMDDWTDERISQMDAGGNETFSSFLTSRGIEKEWEVRKKYSTKQALFYGATLKRRSRGKPASHDPVVGARKSAMCDPPVSKKSMTDLEGVALKPEVADDEDSNDSDSDSDSDTHSTTSSDISSDVPVDPGNYNVEYGGDALGPDRLPGETFEAYIGRQARVRPQKMKSLRRSSMLKAVSSVGDSVGSSSRFSLTGMLGLFGVQDDGHQASEELRKDFARGTGGSR